jgi:hypothetical protein
MPLDPAWIGVIGTGIGALASGLPAFGSAVVSSVSARGQRAHDAAQADAKREADAAEAKAQRDHEEAKQRRQQAAQMMDYRRATIADWREKLRHAHIEHNGWRSGNTNIAPQPNVVSREWFEELRPHLSGDAQRFRTARAVYCDSATVALLSLEIGRIEREWTAEAQG